MALKATVQGGAGKARNRGFQGLEAVVERQEDVPPKGNGNDLFFGHEHCGGWFWPHHRIDHRRAIAPFGYGFGVEVVPGGERLQAFLTTLDCGPYCRCCAGTVVEYLSRNLVRNPEPEITPPYSGTIPLETLRL